MDGIVIKRGDTLALTARYVQPDGTPVNMEGFAVEVNVIDEMDKVVMSVVSTATTNLSNRKVVVVNAANGEFRCAIKDTDKLKYGVYYVDFTYISPEGVAQSSKAIKMTVKGKLV